MGLEYEDLNWTSVIGKDYEVTAGAATPWERNLSGDDDPHLVEARPPLFQSTIEQGNSSAVLHVNDHAHLHQGSSRIAMRVTAALSEPFDSGRA